jgi:hypothetical protein
LELHPPLIGEFTPLVSHIATALAKSKGKDVRPAAGSVTSVPTLRVEPVGDSPILNTAGTAPAPARRSATVAPGATPAPAVGPPKKRKKLIVVAGLVIVVVGGLAAWLLLGGENPLANSVPPPPPPSVSRTKVAPVAINPERKGPSDALAAKVRLLAITAAAGGSSQRLSIGGKVYEPGETVTEGLILQSIENDEIVFRDADGNLYTRRL